MGNDQEIGSCSKGKELFMDFSNFILARTSMVQYPNAALSSPNPEQCMKEEKH
ncbi:hypothetical protein [Legionella jordanis]|uniref:hypothetical protein n=1 Tax=Legionella jordanis TaxID=456 RepID=UPI0012E3651C|nr:hypothetical protein [Legionella jordanis]